MVAPRITLVMAIVMSSSTSVKPRAASGTGRRPDAVGWSSAGLRKSTKCRPGQLVHPLGLELADPVGDQRAEADPHPQPPQVRFGVPPVTISVISISRSSNRTSLAYIVARSPGVVRTWTLAASSIPGLSSSAVFTRPSGPGLRRGCTPQRNTPAVFRSRHAALRAWSATL